jgi:hypothetical protein
MDICIDMGSPRCWQGRSQLQARGPRRGGRNKGNFVILNDCAISVAGLLRSSEAGIVWIA